MASSRGSAAAQLSSKAMQGRGPDKVLKIRPTASAPLQGLCTLQPPYNHRDVHADHSPQEATKHPKLPGLTVMEDKPSVHKVGAM